MAKYIPAKSYIGSSEVATDFNVTGPSTLSNTLTVGVDDTGHDVKFFGATSGKYVFWDESEDALRFQDGVIAKFGTGKDLQIQHDGSNSYIDANGTGDLIIEQMTADQDIIFKCDDGSGGETAYLTLDGGNKLLKAPDGIGLYFGDSIDLGIQHNGSHSYIQHGGTGDLYIQNNQTDRDIILQSDDGSGGTATYLTLDGSVGYTTVQKRIRFDDNVFLGVGTGNNFTIDHDGSHTSLQNSTGNLYIKNYADDSDIVFQSDDGSGGIETYFYCDGSVGFNRFPYPVIVEDSVNLNLGTGQDMQLVHNGTDSKIDNNTGDLYISNNTNDKDIILRSDDGSGGVTPYLTLDGSATNMKVAKDMRFNDNVDAEFGTSGDFKIYHDGSNTYLEQINAGTGNIVISNANDDADIIFQSDNGSGGVTAYLTLDGSTPTVLFGKNGKFPDSIKAQFGTGLDLQIYHDGTDSYIDEANGDLYIRNGGNDKDVIFQCDDGSGGLATYLTLDGSATKTIFSKPIEVGADGAGHDVKFFLNASGRYIMVDEDENSLLFTDNASAKWGNGGDLQLMHDGTDSRIDNMVGHLKIRNYSDDSDIIFETDNGSGGTTEYLRLDGGDKTLIASVPLIPSLGVTKPVAETATNVAAAVSGTIYNFSDADGATVTLPDSGEGTYIGTTFEFIVSVTATSNSHKIIVSDTTNEKLTGQLIGIDTDTDNAVTFYIPASSNKAITMDGSTTGKAASRIKITCYAVDRWNVEGYVHQTGSPATPFSDS